jgi:prepilin-type N-terminal cleavage/methylation domain-containing protein
MRVEISNARRERGFTLLELMITIAIIGILAATAITSFTRYQWRTKRSEAYANLESIRKVQITYATEFGGFIQSDASPAGVPNGNKRNWKSTGSGRFSTMASGLGFELIGWVPEGATFFDYEVTAAADTGNGPSFMAAAFGDVDDDGFISAFLYAYPDNANAVPDCSICGGLVPHSGPPLDFTTSLPVYNTVAPVFPPGADDF